MPLQLLPAGIERPASSVAEVLEILVVASCPCGYLQEVTALLVALAAAAAAAAGSAAAAAGSAAAVAGTEPAEGADDAAGVATVQQAVHYSAWTPCHADCP